MSNKNSESLAWLKPWGFALGLAALVGWVLDRSLPAELVLSSGVIAVACALAVGAASGAWLHIWMAWPSAELLKPRLLLFKSQGTGIFVFSPVDWLSYRAAYTIFVTEPDGFERLLCAAEVVVIQDDGNVQLVAARRGADSENVWSSLENGSKDHFSKIVVKPGGPLID